MRYLFCIFSLAFFFSPAWAAQMTCLVVGVTDGDTINVRCGQPDAYEQIKVRFGAIDAPESRQPFGQRSKQALSDLVYMQQVQLDCYKQSPDAQRKYEQTEQQAMQAQRGLWSDPHAMPPWEWRKK